MNKAVIVTFDVIERIIFAIGGILCVIPDSRTDIVGLIIMVAACAFQIIRKKITK